jgi:hypothetical protein
MPALPQLWQFVTVTQEIMCPSPKCVVPISPIYLQPNCMSPENVTFSMLPANYIMTAKSTSGIGDTHVLT